MFMKLYTPRNVVSVAFHYGATAAVLAGSVLLGPVWAIGASALLVGGVSYMVVKAQKELMENNLVRHPDAHRFSPNLGKIATELYRKSGLKAEDYPVYDFRVDEKKMRREGKWEEGLGDIFGKAALTHNAAAMRVGKPVIMISEPLLKLLNDEEEKAVLAHEFAHVVAHHSRIGLPQRALMGVVGLTNTMTKIAVAVSTGWAGVLSAIGGRIASGILFRTFHDKDKLLHAKNDELSIPELVEKKKIVGRQRILGSAVMASILTYFEPVYLAVYVASKTLSAAGSLLQGTLSRSMEYQADRGAVKLGANPLALITSLRKMTIIQDRAKKELLMGAEMPKAGWLSRAWKQAQSTHPKLERRIKRLADIAQKEGFSQAEVDVAVRGRITVSRDNNMPYHVIDSLVRGM